LSFPPWPSPSGCGAAGCTAAAPAAPSA